MNETIPIEKMSSQQPPLLTNLTPETLKTYFKNTWSLYATLFSSLKDESTFLMSPDPLRNPLIFYWGHTAAFYINKLVRSGLLQKGIHPHYESLFAVGVDPDLPENLKKDYEWPTLQEVNEYREKVYQTVLEVIDQGPYDDPVNWESPWWALLMGMEHDRIHFETSSVLIRQLPTKLLQKPKNWKYAPTFGHPPANPFLPVAGGTVIIGKPAKSNLYGWDNEYGQLQSSVAPFKATKNLISNAEYLEFYRSGAYHNSAFWTSEGQAWKKRVNAQHPRFWVKKGSGFAYRAMFDEIPMPLDWPVEVNAYEAQAYCHWKGQNCRLLSEAEFNLIANKGLKKDPARCNDYHLNLAYGSPCPVGMHVSGQSPDGFNDLYGNVWDWLSDDFYPLPGFKKHPWYVDFSAPFFDADHGMLLGGAWATTGTGASRYYRLWFRRNFYQHAGFRVAMDV